MNVKPSPHHQKRKPICTHMASVNRRGAIVLPKVLRERMGIRPDDRVIFQMYGDVVEITLVEPLALEEIFGSVESSQPVRDLEEIIQEAKEEHYLDRFNRKHRA